MDYNYKRKRRKAAQRAAKRAEKETAGLELSQPELIRQPMPFQTNKFWAEEIEAGPGPPKGWKRDDMDGGARKDGSQKKGPQRANASTKKKSVFAQSTDVSPSSKSSPPTSSSSSEPAKTQPRPLRPSLDQKQSALDTLRGTFRASLSPESWNWKRYEREDEPLWGLNDALTRIWDRARPGSNARGSASGPSEHRRSLSRGRKRAGTTESDQYDYYRARYPDVNDLHPPVVSQLAATKAEVAWMLQPPPSRAVMEGKVRPGTEVETVRRPLARIGTTKEEDWRNIIQDGQSNPLDKKGKDPDNRKQHPPAIMIQDDERHGENEEESDREENNQREELKTELEVEALPIVLRPKSNVAKLPSQASPSIKKRKSWQPQRPPLATLALEKTTNSIHSSTLPVPAPRLNSRSPSPSSSYLGQRTGKLDLGVEGPKPPPEWDYLLEFCMPQVPPRTRSSLPSGVWV